MLRPSLAAAVLCGFACGDPVPLTHGPAPGPERILSFELEPGTSAQFPVTLPFEGWVEEARWVAPGASSVAVRRPRLPGWFDPTVPIDLVVRAGPPGTDSGQLTLVGEPGYAVGVEVVSKSASAVQVRPQRATAYGTTGTRIRIPLHVYVPGDRPLALRWWSAATPGLAVELPPDGSMGPKSGRSVEVFVRADAPLQGRVRLGIHGFSRSEVELVVGFTDDPPLVIEASPLQRADNALTTDARAFVLELSNPDGTTFAGPSPLTSPPVPGRMRVQYLSDCAGVATELLVGLGAFVADGLAQWLVGAPSGLRAALEDACVRRAPLDVAWRVTRGAVELARGVHRLARAGDVVVLGRTRDGRTFEAAR